MSRMDTDRFNSRPKHETFQIRLLRLLADFETTVVFNETPCYGLRRMMIDLIHVGREDIERCTTSFNDLIKYGLPPRDRPSSLVEHHHPNHMEMIGWCNDMSIACKLVNIRDGQKDFVGTPIHDAVLNEQIANARKRLTDLAFLQKGKELVAELDNCRVSNLYGYPSNENRDPWNF